MVYPWVLFRNKLSESPLIQSVLVSSNSGSVFEKMATDF